MRRLWLVGGILLAVVWILLGVHYYRYRFVRANSDLVHLLPPGDLNLVFADLDLIRKAELLGLLANIKVAPDKEYLDFIRQTGFDYTRDLDAIAIGADGLRTYLIGRGRFDWDKLQGFAASHQGQCQAEACSVPATTPGRWVNLILVQPDVLAVAISALPTGADELRPPGKRLQEEIPSASVWAKPSHALLSNPTSLPLPIQIFAISLQSAGGVTLAVQPDRVELKASFPNGAEADTARRQLEIQTKFVTAALKSEKPDRASFAGMLTRGSFQVFGADVRGVWPVDPELLKALR